MSDSPSSVVVTGLGIVCSIAQNVSEFARGLREGRCGITSLDDPSAPSGQTSQIGGVIRGFSWQNWLENLKPAHPLLFSRARKALNNTTDSTRFSACAAMQAYLDAKLGDGSQPLDDVGLIVGGNNLSQGYIAQNAEKFRQPNRRINPKYAISFFDSNQVGSISEILSLRGMGFTIGAASASGNAAIFNAFQWIRHGLLERCLVVGANMDLSPLEWEGFAILGAAFAGGTKDPSRACRPFDQTHEGFVWGQGSACVMLESKASAQKRNVPIQGEIAGASLVLDGHHHPDPSVDGEIRAMQAAIAQSGVRAGQIGYVNAHGTSSPLGDRTECQAIRTVFRDHLAHVRINSTKSLIGHCLSAAGVIEMAACLIQLNHGFLHPNLNLREPIDPDLNFACSQAEPLHTACALSNSFGFGGINSSLVLKKTPPSQTTNNKE
ncbi:MAG: beta-ketoacyl synthase N-terminal-like domain-containing protein [Verrucomicrobiae bacterium]|nr:beta-ketoacyl synthase N-terminal-like domain-containing protein [Verrucomicrobiae bacterium]